ncbi:YeiH family protein [Noviherbaspirillum sp. Root189]|uniref:YeiH family protein n=1 Tax=Noviherbaspirillum sp. Root189 TaxID=1736487 RepID=UPI00070E50A9|nr:putative sulfate exporter family transporter [Noviherbaspirillum sp. Root189]KRB81023.1 hypothetical protein ASE07_24730 [Noviherbaspirillum sp. Root189]
MKATPWCSCSHPHPENPFVHLLSSLKALAPGVALGAVVALAASFVASTYGGPHLLYALFFGLGFHFLSRNRKCRPGIEFSSKTLLRTGVALLGVKISAVQVIALGWQTLAVAILVVPVTIGFGLLLARILRRTTVEGVISASSVGICGASAALAVAAALPQSKENERFTLLTVIGVTSLSTLAMIVYPLIVTILELDPTAAGIFIGGTIHDVAQVVGAGYLISPHTGDTATLVKLTRVACLVPVVLLVSAIFKVPGNDADDSKMPLPMPTFLLGFVILVGANSLNIIPPVAVEWAATASRYCLVIAIAALGIKTSLGSLRSLGWAPLVMLLADTLWIATIVLAVILFA